MRYKWGDYRPFFNRAITEFAIVVAGFTGLVLALGSKDQTPSPVVKLRTVTMLFYAFTAAFVSLLPTLAQSLGIAEIWHFSGYVFVALLFANTLATVLSSRILLSPSERAELSTIMWSLVLAGNTLFGAMLVLSLLGMVGLPVNGAFFAALIWQLVLSTILFTRLILQRQRMQKLNQWLTLLSNLTVLLGTRHQGPRNSDHSVLQ